MDKTQLSDILDNSPSIKLLKMRPKNLKFFLTFLLDTFEEQTVVPWESIHLKLVNRLDELEEDALEEEEEVPSTLETNEEKAKRWIQDWANKGYLTNYQDEVGEIRYEISSYTSKVLDWIENSLKKEDYIGTESKFKALFHQLKELVEFTNEDRSKRLDLLRNKKLEIEQQIQRLEMGEDIQVFEEFEIVPRYNSLNKMAKELLSDFKEVDNNFKDIIKQIYQQQTENSKKKEILHYFFDAYSELKNSSQGKSFYAFWEFLLSASLQKEWEMLTQNLYESLNSKQIDVRDLFLRDVKHHLMDAGQRVYHTNNRMAEKLSRIIRQNEQSNSALTQQLINDIKHSLIDVSKQKSTPNFGFEIETWEIKLPLERRLTLEPIQEIIYTDKPKDAQLSIEDLSRLDQLYNPYYVDRQLLRQNINQILEQTSQTTLGEVIEASNGISKGLTELLGYLGILKEYSTVINTDKTQAIVFDEANQKKIIIPEIIIIRQ
ncbi:hypothetical protein EVA_19932 [gut metagenome]|uniref:DUF3375 domain-containing protein n=1 Tax=gut metagenome TaxID=749906 RepID=J9FC20_9ZZZZ